ncbi:hypothetical protein TRVL_08016 [Trypanosoma vivax]|nr:hypothetical protein TRVL_08016 [Trypanosoma vivax]
MGNKASQTKAAECSTCVVVDDFDMWRVIGLHNTRDYRRPRHVIKRGRSRHKYKAKRLAKKRGSTRETLDNTVHSYATALRAFSLTRQHCSYTPLVCCKVSAGQTHICNNNKIKPNKSSAEKLLFTR